MPGLVLFDFADPRAVDAWRAIDDRVMGGASRSRLRHDPAGHACFEGEVSFANGGGFASVRSVPGPRGLDGATALDVEVRGDGRPYKLGLRADDRIDGVGHDTVFTPDGHGWQLIALPLAAFRASFRGRPVPDAPPLPAAGLRQVGLMTAGRQAGPFALHVRRITLR
jgi:NADH dehydrogenase [ubiquinone] 1 alpha subcomplex assembly factor 1